MHPVPQHLLNLNDVGRAADVGALDELMTADWMRNSVANRVTSAHNAVLVLHGNDGSIEGDGPPIQVKFLNDLSGRQIVRRGQVADGIRFLHISSFE